LIESVKQKTLIIEHLFKDANYNHSKILNESAISAKSANDIKCINEENKKKNDSDSKSCNEVYATNNAVNSGKKNKLVGFFSKIFK